MIQYHIVSNYAWLLLLMAKVILDNRLEEEIPWPGNVGDARDIS